MRKHTDNQRLKLTAGLAMACAMAIGNAAFADTVLLREDFEAADALQAWKQETHFSETEAVIESPGQLSSNGLKIVKHDNCGYYAAKRSVAVSGGRWLRLSADVKVERMLLRSGYAFMVTKRSKGVAKAPNLFFEFDDGIQRKTGFGGTHKSPQTMGEWAHTEHLFQPEPDVDEVTICLIVNGGAQTIRFDNMLLEDVGLEQPARQVRRVFARLINWPYAELDLDCLFPGCAYELAADVIPAPSNVV
ncbi:MAG: hypothetical protein PHR35_09765, partial [Kiritimatiellae bacterium]|nr:hypothetical protein [Kiritimatiellia bacterium]